MAEASVVRTGQPILDRASLECQPARFTAFCGPNGAGKTTALSLLSGAVRADMGEVTMNERPIPRFKPIELARTRAVVAQSSALNFPFHVHEVVEMGRTPWAGRTSRRRDSEIVATVMAEMEISQLGARNYLTLSGGERQRVNIARALAQLWDEPRDNTPRWLLLDEPTAALDLRHQIALLALLERLARQGWGVVAVLHDLHLVHEHADEVVLFKNGRVLEAGAARTALTPRGVQRAYDLEEPYEFIKRGSSQPVS
ncbi:MAG: heme ABC transporter ATP-binding protein [Pseudomonadota bacterium]